MTRIYLDSREIWPIPPDVNSLEQVIGMVEARHLPPNRVIRDIQVDGIHLMRGEGRPDFPEEIRKQETIEIFTSTLRDVAVESIREAVSYLDRAEAATLSIAMGLRNQDDPEAFVELRQFYEGIHFVNVLLSCLERSFQIPLQELPIRDSNAQEYCVRLASRLKQVIEAHEQNALRQLADLLEYDIAPLIPPCKEIFASIRARILLE